MTSLLFDSETLRPLINEIVLQVLAQQQHINSSGESRFAWREDEAAALIGMAPYQLRDRRLEGLVSASKIGRSRYYTREELLRLFAATCPE